MGEDQQGRCFTHGDWSQQRQENNCNNPNGKDDNEEMDLDSKEMEENTDYALEDYENDNDNDNMKNEDWREERYK